MQNGFLFLYSDSCLQTMALAACEQVPFGNSYRLWGYYFMFIIQTYEENMRLANFYAHSSLMLTATCVLSVVVDTEDICSARDLKNYRYYSETLYVLRGLNKSGTKVQLKLPSSNRIAEKL